MKHRVTETSRRYMYGAPQLRRLDVKVRSSHGPSIRSAGLPDAINLPWDGLARRRTVEPCRCGKAVVLELRGAWRCVRCGRSRDD